MTHRLRGINQHALQIAMWRFFSKLKIELPCDPTTPCLDYLPEGLQVSTPQTRLHLPLYYCTVHSSQVLKKAWHPPTNEQIKAMAYVHDDEAFASHIEQNCVTGRKVDVTGDCSRR